MCDNCNFSPWNHKMRSVDTCKFQSHSIFDSEHYCIAACFLTIYITFIARRCSRGAWLGITAFPQIPLPEIARQDLLTHVSFNPIRFSKIIVSLHVFWEFPLLETARQDRVRSADNCKFQSNVIFEIVSWPSTSHLLPEGGKVLDLALQCFLKMRLVNTCKFQFHSIFACSMFSECFLSSPWNSKTRSVDTCKFQPIRASISIPFDLLELIMMFPVCCAYAGCTMKPTFYDSQWRDLQVLPYALYVLLRHQQWQRALDNAWNMHPRRAAATRTRRREGPMGPSPHHWPRVVKTWLRFHKYTYPIAFQRVAQDRTGFNGQHRTAQRHRDWFQWAALDRTGPAALSESKSGVHRLNSKADGRRLDPGRNRELDRNLVYTMWYCHGIYHVILNCDITWYIPPWYIPPLVYTTLFIYHGISHT